VRQWLNPTGMALGAQERMIMMNAATGMKPGERYQLENAEREHQFQGFFLDGKYYLGPELLTAVGWLEGQHFIYDDLDASGEPVFPDRVAGTIEGLVLTMADGATLALARIDVVIPIAAANEARAEAQEEPDPDISDDQIPRLQGKVVVITGASSGIGRAAAKAFGCEGARLVLAARDEEALFDVLDECTECGTEAVAITTDVTSSEQMLALAKGAAEFGNGHIDIWINNAGVGAVGSFDDTPLEAHEQVIQTDLLGYLRGTYVAWPFFKEQGSGILINTLSVGSWVPQPYAAAYSASKFGLRGLTEALRGELTEYPDIHICDIYPAVMDTPGLRDGGNFTDHELAPPPPVYDPRLVADAMVACAIKPRVSTTVGGAARVARLAHFLVPGFSYMSGWLTRRAIRRSATADRSSGNLFAPTDFVRSVEGGWRRTKPTHRLLLTLAVAALIGGVTAQLLRRKR
jgi:NAD(P)-dependent dehydrogenase (short-subunit alcohol dehydrogenase family)